MRILTIAATPYFSNRGCHIRIFLGAKYLQKKGVDVLLCTYHLGENVGDFGIKTTGKTPWYKKTSPGFAWGKIWLDAKLLWLCIKEVRSFKPDAIHAHLFEGFAISYLAKMFAGRPSLPIAMDSQGDIEAEFNAYNKKDKLAKTLFVPLAKGIVRLADYIILSSENALPFFDRISKVKNKISVVKDGVGIELFKEDRQENLNKDISLELERIKQWKCDGKVLIYTGGMNNSKGVKKLVEHFLLLGRKQGLENWKLLLFGAGTDRDSYRKIIKQAGAEDRVKFTKETSFFALPKFLKIADVAIDPKEKSTEGSGKLENYMAVGLPIICFDSQFNRKRLGRQGFYLEKMSDLRDVLKKDFSKKMEYTSNTDTEDVEIEKLFSVFAMLVKEQKCS